jgi:hypothetical protein
MPNYKALFWFAYQKGIDFRLVYPKSVSSFFFPLRNLLSLQRFRQRNLDERFPQGHGREGILDGCAGHSDGLRGIAITRSAPSAETHIEPRCGMQRN